MGNRYRAVILVSIVTVLFSCGGGKHDTVLPERKSIDPSPTKVVEELLKAWQKEDFERAFKYVYAPYSDVEGYVIQMKNYFKENQVSILEFQVLGTQIYDRTAIVVVELKQKVKSSKTGSVIELNQRSQYDLGLFDDEWKVTAGNCIQNCIKTEPAINTTDKK